jgi:hypothetical protein
MTLDDSPAANSSGRRQTLGFCWIVYAILRLIIGICLVVYSGTSTVMFGALLVRVPDPFALMSDFHIVYVVCIIVSFLCALLGLLAGLALLANQGSARTLALLAAFFSVSEIPFGTTLGIYTLVVFLRPLDTSRPNRSS